MNNDRSKIKELYISVDIETSGPIPGEYSLLTIGACLTENPEKRFECLVKPLNGNYVKAAMETTGLSISQSRRDGCEPIEAMNQFASWINAVGGVSCTPVFVGLNAPFDWSFINYYFHKFTKINPFGISALDIKSLYMGLYGCSWSDTNGTKMGKRLNAISKPNHRAIDDAIYQAELFRLIKSISEKRLI